MYRCGISPLNLLLLIALFSTFLYVARIGIFAPQSQFGTIGERDDEAEIAKNEQDDQLRLTNELNAPDVTPILPAFLPFRQHYKVRINIVLFCKANLSHIFRLLVALKYARVRSLPTMMRCLRQSFCFIDNQALFLAKNRTVHTETMENR